MWRLFPCYLMTLKFLNCKDSCILDLVYLHTNINMPKPMDSSKSDQVCAMCKMLYDVYNIKVATNDNWTGRYIDNGMRSGILGAHVIKENWDTNKPSNRVCYRLFTLLSFVMFCTFCSVHALRFWVFQIWPIKLAKRQNSSGEHWHWSQSRIVTCRLQSCNGAHGNLLISNSLYCRCHLHVIDLLPLHCIHEDYYKGK